MVSTMWLMRTLAAGMSGLASRWPRLDGTASNSPTSNAARHGLPAVMRMTGSAHATHSSARSAWKGASHGSVVRMTCIWAKKLPGSSPP